MYEIMLYSELCVDIFPYTSLIQCHGPLLKVLVCHSYFVRGSYPKLQLKNKLLQEKLDKSRSKRFGIYLAAHEPETRRG